jgi:disulfide oxidoreductase YuzD
MKRSYPDPNFTFRYIDDVLSLNNSRFGDFVDRIYPIELEIKDTTDTDRYASYLDIDLEIDSEGRFRTKIYDKRDYVNFPVVNFPFICSNIPAAPAYGVYISKLIQHPRACGSYQDFLDRGLLLTRKLLNLGFLLVKLKSSLGMFYGRHHDLVDR